jgi:hypothetical protein
MSAIPDGSWRPIEACSNRPQPTSPWAGGAADVVDVPEGDAGQDGRVGEVDVDPLRPAAPLPRAVRPLGIAVARAEVQRDEPERLDVDAQRLARRRRAVQGRRLGVPGAGAVADLRTGPAELLDAAVLPDPGGVVQRPVAVGLLLGDDDDRVVVEAQRHVQPPEPALGLLVPPAGRVRRRQRADAPRAVPGAEPRVGRDGLVDPVEGDRALPRADLGEAGRLQDHPRPLADDVGLLLQRRERALPGDVDGQAVLGRLGDDAHLLQRLDDLDPVAADPQPLVAQGVGEADRRHPVAPLHRAVAVDHAGVRVDAHAGDEERLAGAVVAVEVAAVVEVAIAGADRRHGQRRLVDRVLVERRERHAPQPISHGEPFAVGGERALDLGRLDPEVGEVVAVLPVLPLR